MYRKDFFTGSGFLMFLILSLHTCLNAQISLSYSYRSYEVPSAGAQNASPWPSLPLSCLPNQMGTLYANTIAELDSLLPGTTFAKMEPGYYKVCQVDFPLKDDVLGIVDYTIDIEDFNTTFTIKDFRIHDPQNGKALLVWNNLTAQPMGGMAMELTAAVKNRKLLGYKYDVKTLGLLKAGDEIAILDSETWRVVTIANPLKNNILDIEDFKATKTDSNGKAKEVVVKELRLIDILAGRAGLVWNIY